MRIIHWQQIESLLEKNENIFSHYDGMSCKKNIHIEKTATETSAKEKKCYAGISVGSFDGIHLGHRQLIETLTENCKKNGWKSGVLTFLRPLPSFKQPDYKGDLSTLDQRLQIFRELGLDFVILVDFNEKFASLSGVDFFEIIRKTCNLKYIVEGVDFRCGYKGQTDAQKIREWIDENNLDEKNGMKCDFISPVFFDSKCDGKIRISSSYIRTKVLQGDFETVNALLYRRFSLYFDDTASEHHEISQVLPDSEHEKTYPVTAVFFDGKKMDGNVSIKNKLLHSKDFDLQRCREILF